MRKIKVWKVTEKEGTGRPLYIDRMAVWDEIQGGIDYEEEGNQYVIEVIEVDPDWFKNLPEWDGF